MSKIGIRRRLSDGITMFIVTGLSLLLLLYVGFGEGKRGYEQIHIEKITAQGRLIQNSIEKYLRDDLPLGQYAGFQTLVAPIVESDDFDAIAVYDNLGRQVFVVIDKTKPQLPEPSSAIMRIKQDIEVDYGETHYQIVLPLRTRYDTVGSLVVMSPTKIVTQRLRAGFETLPFLVAALSLLFAVIIAIASPSIQATRFPWIPIGYALTFVIMSLFVILTLVTLYFDGIQGKAKASAFTLSQRVNDVIEFKLNVKDFVGLESAFKEYLRLNSEISEAAMIIDDRIVVTTDDKKKGSAWASDPKNFEYAVDLSRADQQRRISLAVTVPRNVVYGRVMRSVKNFAALFIGAAFLSGLFLQVAGSLQRQRSSREAPATDADMASLGEATLVIVKPVFFLAVFLDSLTYSFLPKFMQSAALASGASVGFASLPFTAYYLCFALSLIPAGNFADRYGPRPLILTGLVLASASVLGLALPLDIWTMTVLRSLSGVGQGVLFIGVQTYILSVTPPAKKTQGAAIIVFGFQGGMISGMALGSLMVNFLQPQGIFMLAGMVGCATCLYAIRLIPSMTKKQERKVTLGVAISRLYGDLKKVMTNGEFLKAIFFIGIPAKAILTGTVTFALPLLLGQLEYRQEDIGQIIMLYGLGVVAASGHVSRVVDRTRNTQSILFWGATLSGAGLVLIGLVGNVSNAVLGTAIVIIGVVVVGIAHGFINAPVVTHVGQSDLADRIGANPVTTTYRFLERIGHVAGPFLVSQLFLIWGQGLYILTWIGMVTAGLGVLFLLGNFSTRMRMVRTEPAE
jgi:MFS family permease